MITAAVSDQPAPAERLAMRLARIVWDDNRRTGGEWAFLPVLLRRYPIRFAMGSRDEAIALGVARGWLKVADDKKHLALGDEARKFFAQVIYSRSPAEPAPDRRNRPKLGSSRRLQVLPSRRAGSVRSAWLRADALELAPLDVWQPPEP